MVPNVVVFQSNPAVVARLRKLPLFRGIRIVKPGRLWTAAEFAAYQQRQRLSKADEISAFLASELTQMERISDSIFNMEVGRRRRARSISNHKPLPRSLYSTVRP